MEALRQLGFGVIGRQRWANIKPGKQDQSAIIMTGRRTNLISDIWAWDSKQGVEFQIRHLTVSEEKLEMVWNSGEAQRRASACFPMQIWEEQWAWMTGSNRPVNFTCIDHALVRDERVIKPLTVDYWLNRLGLTWNWIDWLNQSTWSAWIFPFRKFCIIHVEVLRESTIAVIALTQQDSD